MGRLFAFDAVKWVWTSFSAPATTFAAANLLAWGGFIVAVGGATDAASQVVQYIPTSAGPDAPWTAVQTSNSLDAHDGHRLVDFGGVLYMMGGITTADGSATVFENTNAMWALDLASYFGTAGRNPSLSWVRLQGSGAAGVWSPRVGFSLSVYAATIYLFGGLQRDPNYAGGAADPVCTDPAAKCVAFSDLWRFQPGLSQAPLSATQCNVGGCTASDVAPKVACNCGWSAVSPAGAAPPARYDHAAGVVAGNLYVFGGVSAAGAFLTDLWLFSTESNAWVAVASAFQGTAGFVGGGLPAPLHRPSMAVVGHNLYVETTGDRNANALYKWTPEAPAPPRGGGAAAAAAGGDYAGHTAGIVIGLLVGLATLALLLQLAAHNGVAVLALPSLGGRALAAADGFYSSASRAPPAAAYAAAPM